jgi:hypothetical protein
MKTPIPTLLVASAALAKLSPARIASEFGRLIDDGVEVRVAGKATPRRLLSGPYAPKGRVDLFDTSYYLSDVRQNEDIRFFVAYVVSGSRPEGAAVAHARLFYKDASLIWRVASHFTDEWIGKGDLKPVLEDGEEKWFSAEETTDLPLEIQGALETMCRRAVEIPYDRKAQAMVLKKGPLDRVVAYRDFTEPRQRARENPRNLVNRGKRVAFFARRNDPTSLRFVAGFEPDFTRGVLEVGAMSSRLYGGPVRRFRIVSRNRKIQYLFMAGPRHVWIVPPQALTTEISSYGVRTIDVLADDDLFVPGYEYHFRDDSVDPPWEVSQIPVGFVGARSPVDEGRADASPWLDRLPVVREFRRKVLNRRRSTGAATRRKKK